VHIVVDPVLSVSAAHQIAERVRLRVRRAMPAVADLLVHIGMFSH
jgi:divalent metal cation (Fe/Co/Zn/Cd) transporter